MSSPKSVKALPRARPPAHATVKQGHRAAKLPSDSTIGAGNGGIDSNAAQRLAAGMERALASGRRDLLSTAALQALMAAVCKTYAAQIEAGDEVLPLPQRGGATATEVMVTASGLLKAANLAVFELGMWQSWTGR
ncbi:MAG: hypothetical protein E6G96_03895 [Alphaproteobacteria bacterium]|nr:MAG: hypothetical protein E6G96_03895 [Alphaproteobacteria bacterium]